MASIARIDVDGRYTGELEQYAYGAEKARLIEELAARDGVNLAASYAYSDSATDVPMLEAVGHPVAVNPDRGLRRIARQRAWATCQFTRRLSPDAPDEAERAPGRGGGARPSSGATGATRGARLGGLGVMGPLGFGGRRGRGRRRGSRGGGLALPVPARQHLTAGTAG